MPAERVEMRRVREILRYRFEQGLGHKVDCGAGWNCALDGARDATACGGSWAVVASR